MTDKEIIIDGVDVSECKYLPYCEDKQGNCGNNPNCYFKQLKRKEQECEKYEQTLFEIKIYCKTALCVSTSKNDINFIQMIIDIIDKAMRQK